jgi:hypothetical protein
VKPYFGQIVGIHQLNYCVQAIVRAKPFRNIPAVFGNAVVGMDPGGLSFHDQSNATKWKIQGGGIFANNNAEDTHTNVTFLDGHCVTAVGSASGFNCGGSYPNPQLKFNYPGNITDPQLGDVSYLNPDPPACDGTAYFNVSDQKIHEDNDASKDGSVWTKGISGDYAPGVYCITDATGQIHSPITGTGVTFYIMDLSFHLVMNGGGGNAYIAATAPTSGKYKGLLMYAPIVDPPCTQTMDIRGNGSTPIVGSIWMPSVCITYIGNSTGDTMDSQMVGYDVYSNGNGTLNINYNNDNQRQIPQPPVLELNK